MSRARREPPGADGDAAAHAHREWSAGEGRRDGRSPPSHVRAALEPALGHSLADVRIFDDAEAHRDAEYIGASAFTVGQDIFFATGRYDLETPAGFHRLAHEITHTVQQRGREEAEFGDLADRAHEDEARLAADASLFGLPVAVHSGNAGAGAIALEEAAATETESQRVARLVGQFPWMRAMFPNWTVKADSGGFKATKTDGMTTTTGSGDVSFNDGFKAHVGQHKVTETDEHHAMESEKQAGWGDSAGYFEWMTGGRWKADDGTQSSDQVRQRLTLGQDTIGARAETTSTRDTVTKSRAMEASLKDGEARGSLEFSRDFKLDDDHQMGSKTGVEVGTKGGSISRETSSRIKDVETGAVNSETTRKGAGYSAKDGFSANYGKENVTEIDGQKFGTGTSGSISTKGIDLNRTKTHTTTGADGKETTTGSGHGVSLNFDGTMGYTATKQDAQGNKTSATFGGSLDPDNLKVNAGVSRNGKSASVNAGESVKASKPRQEGDHWVVDWERKFSAGGAAGAKGASANAGYENSQFGTRRFKSQTEAEAFQANASAKLPSASHDPTTVEGALHLDIGEMRGAGSKTTVGASGELGVTAGGFSGGASKESSNSTQVRRVSEKDFEITFAEGDASGMSFGANTLGAGATGYSKDKAGASKTVRVDVTTAAGREAFERFTKNEGLVGEGAKLIRQSTLTGDDKGQVVTLLPGVTHDRAGFTEKETVLDEQGKTERYTGGTRDDFVNDLPLIGGDKSSMRMQLDQTQKNDQERTYAMRGSVEATGGKASFQHLANLTGTKTWDASGAKSSGKWGVEAEMTPQLMDQFMESVGSEKVRDLGIFNDHTRNDLRRKLQGAKDMDEKMAAISRFIADAGHEGEGMAAIRDELFGPSPGDDIRSIGMGWEHQKRAPGQNFHYDLSLPGDRNFRGIEGRKEIEGKIAGFRTLIEQNPAAAGTLHHGIHDALDEVKRQRAEIADPKRYTDLPLELRENQVARLDQYISQLSGQAEDAGFAFTQQDSAAAEAEEAAAGAPGKGGTPTGPDSALRHVRKEMGILDRTVRFSRSSFEEASGTVTQLMKQVLRENPGQLPPDIAKAWSAANRAWSEANKLKAGASALDPTVNELRSRFVESMDAPDSALGVGSMAVGQLAMSDKMWADAVEKMWQAEGDLRYLVEP